MKARAHISLRHLEHWRHSCIHICDSFPTEQVHTKCRMRVVVAGNQPGIATSILSLTSLCYKHELQLGLPLMSSVFTKRTLASLWGTQQHCILAWISLQRQMWRDKDPLPAVESFPQGPKGWIHWNGTWIPVRLRGYQKVPRAGASLLSLGHYFCAQAQDAKSLWLEIWLSQTDCCFPH